MIKYADIDRDEIKQLLRDAEVVKKHPKAKVTYKNIILTFDIETTRFPTGAARLNGDPEYRSIMYIWQVSFDARITFYGRTWDEFSDFLSLVNSSCGADRVLCFVHNLAYEFAFMRGVYSFNNENAFFMEKRKPLYCLIGNVEFRCSYRLFNMSLDKALKNENVPEEYQKSKMNYDVVRYPWSELTEDELLYCRNDVLGLALAIKHRNEKSGDDVSTMPYTSTGYIRREIKKLTHSIRPLFKGCAPSPYVYVLLRTAFRGGNTHANRAYSNCTVYNVHSVDISSSYPYVLCNRNYPMTPWQHEKTDPEYVKPLIYDKRHALIMHVRFYGIDCRGAAVPYISDIKCIHIEPGYDQRKIDNGRLLSADVCEMSITDIDYKIIVDQYRPKKVEFIAVYSSIYRPLPAVVTNYIKELYYKKCTLKKEDPYYYARSKELLNACYGMSAQDILHLLIDFDGLGYKISKQQINDDNLTKGSLNNALPYAIGVWCTAYAREHLQHGFDVVESHGGKIIYTDTDSIKYTGEVDFTEFNAEVKKKSYTVEYSGSYYTMGVFEIEHTADKFKTLGAKKYAAQYRDELEITIAGVPKKAGAEELKAAGGIDKLDKGFVFHAGKLESVYHDMPGQYIVDGHKVTIMSDVTLYPTTYIVGMTPDYLALITDALTLRKDYDILVMQHMLHTQQITPKGGSYSYD